VDPAVAKTADVVKRQLHALLLDVLLLKASLNLSHEGVKKQLLHHKDQECICPEVKHNIPTDFNSFMSALEQLGERFEDEVDYDYCVRCYSVFRKETKDDDHCACGHPRWKLDQKGNKTAVPNGRFKYRSACHRDTHELQALARLAYP
jgi:hypothetical protein